MGENSNTYNKTVKPNGLHSSLHSSDTSKCEHENFAKRLKEARKKRNLSQRKLGDLVGVSAVTIQNYEKGQFPKGEYLIILAKKLGCSVDWLLTGEGSGVANVELEHESSPAEADQVGEISISELLVKTTKILESRTMYSRALSHNINAFYESVLMEDEIYKIRSEHLEFKNEMEKFRKELQRLQNENRQLREKIGIKNPGDEKNWF